MTNRKRYYLTVSGHAEGVDIAIRSPDRRVLAAVTGLSVFGDTGGVEQAKADARLIVDALNASRKR